ncbi:FtsX-like permease family protein [Nonomuraea soli]|uniref:ABC3 transporter permease C-terminal domain-containing protein n=1 Tax=Nonomuraea soli TaxID=1032476 RepID=A0A7W0CK04_9ACTN|nr:FtsX-like permease family protein [Nonomuraea soli]MBA2892596.1 hypothetical protein [Nonomuraea soli]
MTDLLRMLRRGRSRAERIRDRLTAAGSAMAAFLLCYGISLVDLGDEWSSLAGLALGIMAVPAAGLIHQAHRLATTTRERRLAALRLAGATPAEVRRLGALEGGRLALLGSLAGSALYLLTHLTGPYTQVPVIVALVTAGGVVAGARAGRHVVATPLGVVRRARRRGPRVLDLLLAVAGVAMVVTGFFARGRFPLFGKYGTAVLIAAGLVLILFGLTLAATWLIRAVARRIGSRAASPETLLAARAVEDDPRGWARALSLVALAVFFEGAAGAQQALMGRYLVAHALVDTAVLIALGTAAVALVVHQAEELIDRRRSYATLSAAGVPARALGRVLLRQAMIASAPVCLVASAAGLLVVVAVPSPDLEGIGWAVSRAVIAAVIGVAAAALVAMAARPLLRQVLSSARQEAR